MGYSYPISKTTRIIRFCVPVSFSFCTLEVNLSTLTLAPLLQEHVDYLIECVSAVGKTSSFIEPSLTTVCDVIVHIRADEYPLDLHLKRRVTPHSLLTGTEHSDRAVRMWTKFLKPCLG